MALFTGAVLHPRILSHRAGTAREWSAVLSMPVQTHRRIVLDEAQALMSRPNAPNVLSQGTATCNGVVLGIE